MRPISLSFTPADNTSTGYKSAATGAGPFTPTTTSAGDSLAHLTTLDSTANLSAITFTVTGLDADGRAQTEAITGPNNNTVTGTKYFSSVSSVSASSTVGANTVNIGYADTSITKTIPLDYKTDPFSIGFGVSLTGTINYTIQHTFQNPYDPALTPSTGVWFNHSSVASKTANQDGNYAFNIAAVRLLINSLTAGATIKLELLQGSAT